MAHARRVSHVTLFKHGENIDMSLMEWSPVLDVSVPAMNDQHKILIGFMNELYELHQKGADKAQLAGALKKLGDWAVKHFADEEAYMASVNFPDLDKHKLIHKDLVSKFVAHVQSFEKSGKVEPGLFGFLTFWLTAHIEGLDKKYGAHSTAAGSKK